MSGICPYGPGSELCKHKGIFPYDCEHPLIEDEVIKLPLPPLIRKLQVEQPLCTTKEGLVEIKETLEKRGCIYGSEYKTVLKKLSPRKPGKEGKT